MKRFLFTGFGPHASWKRVYLLLRALIISPEEKTLLALEHDLEKRYGASAVTLVDSGRSALILAIQTVGLAPGDEILVPGYTCMVVANAIRAAGLIPVYVDIDDTLTMSVESAKKAVSSRTKALLLQYTFGEPGHLAELVAFAKAHKLSIIEDAAHTVFGLWEGVLLGTIGDVAITSFGREKAISTERGGALITAHDTFAAQIKKYRTTLMPFEDALAKKYSVSELSFLIGKMLYPLGLGTLFLGLCAKFGIIPRIMQPQEKNGQIPHEPKRFPLFLTPLLTEALRRVDAINSHRQVIASVYDAHIPARIRRQKRSRGTVLLEYSVWVERPELLREFLKKERVISSRSWSDSPIVPKGSLLAEAGYTPGSCPHAETWANGTLSLPTHEGITVLDAKRISESISLYASR